MLTQPREIRPFLIDHIRVYENGIDISERSFSDYKIGKHEDSGTSDHLPLTATIKLD